MGTVVSHFCDVLTSYMRDPKTETLTPIRPKKIASHLIHSCVQSEQREHCMHWLL